MYFYATGAAKDIVLNELLYPKNAEFEEEKTFTVVYDKEKGIYTVSGDVYEANGFNAKKKMFFRVELTLSDLNKDQYSYRKVSCSITYNRLPASSNFSIMFSQYTFGGNYGQICF